MISERQKLLDYIEKNKPSIDWSKVKTYEIKISYDYTYEELQKDIAEAMQEKA
jgi:hypothetical protein